ncbi:MAG TPA: hypothetical protein VGT78_04640 [Rhizomicrobium sp.]|nr:hypothetical protein [Rhizomicrobium sp.]
MAAETIFVFLPREAVAVWAPVDAEYLRDDVYRITNCRGEDDEVEFGKGILVRCRYQKFADGEGLVAFEKIDSQ